MAEPKREELKVQLRRTVLAAVIRPEQQKEKDRLLDELQGLVETAGARVVGKLVQVRETPHPATCLGVGKLEELKHLIARTRAEIVVFDNNLSPAQGRNVENRTDTVVVDRSELILDIFANRARTYEAKLQVELAQLLYFRPRLKRLWTHLERIEGGVGAGRGPGEKQLETDRRLLDKRVAELRRKLALVEKRRERTVRSRSEFPTVSLVGYTNAGKSTLLNALTGAGVYVADKLFATLDTRTRKWFVPHCGEVLLSDTVGFVRDLPHHLVASFKSTLEEARHADLLLHVVDASDSRAEEQIATVNRVLDEIEVDHENTILVLNKVDRCPDRSLIDVLRARHLNSVTVSARTGQGLDQLVETVAGRLAHGYVRVEIETGVENGRLFHYLNEHAKIDETRYLNGSRVIFNCRLPRTVLPRLQGENGTDTQIRLQEPSGSPLMVNREQFA